MSTGAIGGPSGDFISSWRFSFGTSTESQMYDPGWKSNAFPGKPSRRTTSLHRSSDTIDACVSVAFFMSLAYHLTPRSSQKNANVGMIHIAACMRLWRMAKALPTNMKLMCSQ